MSKIRIALAQINPIVGDFKANTEKITNAIQHSKKVCADVVTFPELALCGYPPEDLLFRPKFIRDNRDALESVIKQTQGIIAVIGFADAMDENVYNASALINNGCLVSIYHKVELPNYGVFDEKRYFTAGDKFLAFEINGIKIAINICEDIWIKGSIVEKYTIDNGVKVVLNLSSSPFHAGKLALRRDILAGFARRTNTYVCYNNLVGGQDELVFDGGSLIISSQGQLIASAKRFEEEILITDIDISCSENIDLKAKDDGCLMDYHPTIANELGRIEEIYSALVLGTRDYIRKNGFKKVILGLSGGIDSSLTAVIAVDALGKDNVIGVTMPSQYTSSETRSDAEILAEKLGIQFMTIPINPIFATYLELLKEPFGDSNYGIEAENLQARIRGNILMALSNRFGWLVLTTGNKSETAVGYCTLYGDMAGGFAVIKDVPKTLVYELSEYFNNKSQREIIPKSVFVRPPTAELRPNQKDEDSLPTYLILDPILRAYVEEDKSYNDIVSYGFSPDTVRDVIKMVDRSEYKRRQAPPGVKITPKAFGRDRRLPITNRYKG
ncbi:MAG: NAD+ synthase [Actinobacteria bacterium]|nr:NAD+ synthase [Actinomycetota bacterium]